MQEVGAAKAFANVGLQGDRYSNGRGTFSGERHGVRHVTLISEKDIEAANVLLHNRYTLAETRRNIVVGGAIDLLSLVGREFTVGNVRLRGVEESTPCGHPEHIARKPGFIRAFANRAGIRAALLSSGEIRVGDVVQPCKEILPLEYTKPQSE
jgi:MOSC domain-containing protein YiiM